jgi:SAM-dependent methyltransferase
MMISVNAGDCEAFRRLEEEGWERAAPLFGPCWGPLTALFVAPLLDAVSLAEGERLLDVGCGTGDLAAAAAANRGAVVSALDFSAAMVRETRRRHPGLDIRRGDAADLPFPDARFDRVVMSFVVPHLARPERAFAEARRVLRPGGTLGFTVWATPEENPGARIVEEALAAHADRAVDLPEMPPWDSHGDPAECGRALARAGFSPTGTFVRTVRVEWVLGDKGHLFEAERRAGVRTAALLARQTPDRLESIRRAIEAGVERFAAPGGCALPIAARLVISS